MGPSENPLHRLRSAGGAQVTRVRRGDGGDVWSWEGAN